jgi:hypothetical protein
MEYAVLLLLCYIPLQKFESTLAGYSEDRSVGYGHSRKRRNLVFRQGGLLQVMLF